MRSNLALCFFALMILNSCKSIVDDSAVKGTFEPYRQSSMEHTNGDCYRFYQDGQRLTRWDIAGRQGADSFCFFYKNNSNLFNEAKARSRNNVIIVFYLKGSQNPVARYFVSPKNLDKSSSKAFGGANMELEFLEFSSETRAGSPVDSTWANVVDDKLVSIFLGEGEAQSPVFQGRL